MFSYTAAMLMVGAGANAFLIRRQLGHRSFDSTLADVNTSDKDASAAAAKAFAAALKLRSRREARARFPLIFPLLPLSSPVF